MAGSIDQFSENSSIFPSKILSLLNPFFPSTSLIHHPDNELPLATSDVLNPNPRPPFLSLVDFPSPFCDSVTELDLVQIEKTLFRSYKRLLRRRRVNSSRLHLTAQCDWVSSLESKFDPLVEVNREKKLSELNRKYSWMAEVEGGVNRKYHWTAEIEADNEKKGKTGERKYHWMTKIKGKDDEKQTYT